MPRQLYIADWHFGHKNILYYDNRPFTSVEAMNKALVANWQAAVQPEDTVYVLGDMFWCSELVAVPILRELNGTKVLVRGNHDTTKKAEFRTRFAQIADYLEIEDGGRHVVLSHYPIVCFKNHYYGWHHLYGHVHTSFEANMMQHEAWLLEELYSKKTLMFNVGAMQPWIGYTPRTLDEIIAKSAEYENFLRQLNKGE